MCVCVCVCVVCVCVCMCVFAHVLQVINMQKDASMIAFITVLSIYFFNNNTVSLFETFMTISTMNTKCGTNEILEKQMTAER